MKRQPHSAGEAGTVSPALARVVEAIARDLAREDHDRDLAAGKAPGTLASRRPVAAE